MSGADARAVAARVTRTASGSAPPDRVATLATILDSTGTPIDRGLVLAFDGPRSPTGEDVVELHVHGSPIVVRETLTAIVAAGARLARPGEFSRRAYENGKLDLSAAEAIADLVAAQTRAAALAASANLAGGLARIIGEIRTSLQKIAEEIAAAIDFPDEVGMPATSEIRDRLEDSIARLGRLAGSDEAGRLVREGISLAIVGPPNAGKSSLLNALLGEERAIVSPHAGTTRDTIEETVVIDGVLVRLVDTAGLRSTADPIEAIGVARARTVLASATVALVVIDGSMPLEPAAHAVLSETRMHPRRIVLFNKSDRGDLGFRERGAHEADAVAGSTFAPATIARLRDEIARVGWGAAAVADTARPHLARARHAAAVAQAREALDVAVATLEARAPADLIVPELLAAYAALGAITGEAASEDLIAGIFARFCLGK